MKLRIEAEAEAETQAAAAWYETQRAGLGLDFLAAVDLAIQRIRQAPERFSKLETVPEEDGVRRLLVDRFPYAIIYDVTDQEVAILAVAHTRRRPNYWKYRR